MSDERHLASRGADPTPTGDERDRTSTVYRWNCPICDASNGGLAGRKNAFESAADGLQSHVRMQDGNGHGPKHELPDRLSEEEFAAAIDVSSP